MWNLALGAGVFVTAVLLTGLLRNLALRVQFLDKPVARSAHSNDTPVGGGLVLLLLFMAAAILLFVQGQLPLNVFLALLGTTFVGFLGLVDDWTELHVHWRIPLQFAAAIWVVWWLGEVAPINLAIVSLEAQWLLMLLAVFALVWLLNLYNFMDGIDGIAGSELVFVTMMSFLFAIKSNDGLTASLSGVLMTSAAGFLVWNWPPARIFMGDVGSGFIGFSLGILALLSSQQGSMSIWTWVILLAVFIVDATVTLVRRCLIGEKWYEGHASHAYQIAARRYKSHGKVTITVIAINCFWLAPLAWGSVIYADMAVLLAFLAIAPLSVLAIRLGAGKPDA